MNGLVLGLDIGIASVGVGILKKDTGEIIHANSRLFPLQLLTIMLREGLVDRLDA